MLKTRYSGVLLLLSALAAFSCSDSSKDENQSSSETLGTAGKGIAGSKDVASGGESGGSDPGPAGSGGAGDDGSVDADTSCGETRTTFVDTIVAKQTCSVDTDCGVYYAPCLQKEAGNCAGIFYVSKSSLDTIKQAQSGYDACVGKACDAPPFCAMGELPPTCVDGVCGHK